MLLIKLLEQSIKLGLDVFILIFVIIIVMTVM
jgi:hypothetical protein